MCKPDSKNVDSKGDPTIMVFKLGCSSELTIGCLYNICSVLRKTFKAKLGVYAREVAMLPHSRALPEQNFASATAFPQNAIYFLDPNTFYDFFLPVRPTCFFYAFGFVDSSLSFLRGLVVS